MRVLHVSAGNLYGGLETVLVTLARCRALSPALQCEFALCFAERAEDELRAIGATVHRLGEVRVRWPLSWLRARRALSGLIGRRGFDAVICHSAWSQAIFGRAVRAAGAASIFWLHDVVSGRHWLDAGPPAPSRTWQSATAALPPPHFPRSIPIRPSIAPLPHPRATSRAPGARPCVPS